MNIPCSSAIPVLQAEAEQFVGCGADQRTVPSGTDALAAGDALTDSAPPSTAAEPDACAEQPGAHVSPADPAALYHMVRHGRCCLDVDSASACAGDEGPLP